MTTIEVKYPRVLLRPAELSRPEVYLHAACRVGSGKASVVVHSRSEQQDATRTDDRTRFLARQMIGNNPNPGTGVKCHEVDSTLSTSTSPLHASEALLLSFSPRDSGNFRTLISSRLISESQPVPKEYSKRLEDHLYPDA